MYMSTGDETASRHTPHTHNVPMTFKAITAPVALLAALAAGVAVAIAPAPKAEAATCYGIGMNTAMPMVRCY